MNADTTTDNLGIEDQRQQPVRASDSDEFILITDETSNVDTESIQSNEPVSIQSNDPVLEPDCDVVKLSADVEVKEDDKRDNEAAQNPDTQSQVALEVDIKDDIPTGSEMRPGKVEHESSLVGSSSSKSSPAIGSVISTVPAERLDSETAPQDKPDIKQKRKARFENDDKDLEDLRLVFKHGWRREVVYRSIHSTEKMKGSTCDVYYHPPVGKKLRSMVDVANHLKVTPNSPVELHHFSFRRQPIYEPPYEIVRSAKQHANPFEKEVKAKQGIKGASNKNSLNPGEQVTPKRKVVTTAYLPKKPALKYRYSISPLAREGTKLSAKIVSGNVKESISNTSTAGSSQESPTLLSTAGLSEQTSLPGRVLATTVGQDIISEEGRSRLGRPKGPFSILEQNSRLGQPMASVSTGTDDQKIRPVRPVCQVQRVGRKRHRSSSSDWTPNSDEEHKVQSGKRKVEVIKQSLSQSNGAEDEDLQGLLGTPSKLIASIVNSVPPVEPIDLDLQPDMTPSYGPALGNKLLGCNSLPLSAGSLHPQGVTTLETKDGKKLILFTNTPSLASGADPGAIPSVSIHNTTGQPSKVFLLDSSFMNTSKSITMNSKKCSSRCFTAGGQAPESICLSCAVFFHKKCVQLENFHNTTVCLSCNRKLLDGAKSLFSSNLIKNLTKPFQKPGSGSPALVDHLGVGLLPGIIPSMVSSHLPLSHLPAVNLASPNISPQVFSVNQPNSISFMTQNNSPQVLSVTQPTSISFMTQNNSPQVLSVTQPTSISFMAQNNSPQVLSSAQEMSSVHLLPLILRPPQIISSAIRPPPPLALGAQRQESNPFTLVPINLPARNNLPRPPPPLQFCNPLVTQQQTALLPESVQKALTSVNINTDLTQMPILPLIPSSVAGGPLTSKTVPLLNLPVGQYNSRVEETRAASSQLCSIMSTGATDSQLSTRTSHSTEPSSEVGVLNRQMRSPEVMAKADDHVNSEVTGSLESPSLPPTASAEDRQEDRNVFATLLNTQSTLVSDIDNNDSDDDLQVMFTQEDTGGDGSSPESLELACSVNGTCAASSQTPLMPDIAPNIGQDGHAGEQPPTVESSGNSSFPLMSLILSMGPQLATSQAATDPATSTSFFAGVNPVSGTAVKLSRKTYMTSFRILQTNFKVMVAIFRHLSVSDLLRAASVCKDWNFVATHSCLWKKVCLKGMRVLDWEKAVNFFHKSDVQSLNLNGALLEPARACPSPNLWAGVTERLPTLTSLKNLFFGEVPAAVLDTLTEKMPHLSNIGAETITDTKSISVAQTLAAERSLESMVHALEAVKRGLPTAEAARLFKVTERDIIHLSMTSYKLTVEEETAVVLCCMRLSRMGFPVNLDTVIDKCQEMFARRFSSTASIMLSGDVCRDLYNRNMLYFVPETDFKSLNTLNQKFDLHYSNLRKLFANCMKPKAVLTAGQVLVFDWKSFLVSKEAAGSQVPSVTVMSIMNASGYFLPLMAILPRGMNISSPDFVIAGSKNGQPTAANLYQYIQHIAARVKDRPLVVLFNCNTYLISEKLLSFCVANSIHFYCTPSEIAKFVFPGFYGGALQVLKNQIAGSYTCQNLVYSLFRVVSSQKKKISQSAKMAFITSGTFPINPKAPSWYHPEEATMLPPTAKTSSHAKKQTIGSCPAVKNNNLAEPSSKNKQVIAGGKKTPSKPIESEKGKSEDKDDSNDDEEDDDDDDSASSGDLIILESSSEEGSDIDFLGEDNSKQTEKTSAIQLTETNVHPQPDINNLELDRLEKARALLTTILGQRKVSNGANLQAKKKALNTKLKQNPDMSTGPLQTPATQELRKSRFSLETTDMKRKSELATSTQVTPKEKLSESSVILSQLSQTPVTLRPNMPESSAQMPITQKPQVTESLVQTQVIQKSKMAENSVEVASPEDPDLTEVLSDEPDTPVPLKGNKIKYLAENRVALPPEIAKLIPPDPVELGRGKDRHCRKKATLAQKVAKKLLRMARAQKIVTMKTNLSITSMSSRSHGKIEKEKDIEKVSKEPIKKTQAHVVITGKKGMERAEKGGSDSHQQRTDQTSVVDKSCVESSDCHQQGTDQATVVDKFCVKSSDSRLPGTDQADDVDKSHVESNDNHQEGTDVLEKSRIDGSESHQRGKNETNVAEKSVVIEDEHKSTMVNTDESCKSRRRQVISLNKNKDKHKTEPYTGKKKAVRKSQVGHKKNGYSQDDSSDQNDHLDSTYEPSKRQSDKKKKRVKTKKHREHKNKQTDANEIRHSGTNDNSGKGKRTRFERMASKLVASDRSEQTAASQNVTAVMSHPCLADHDYFSTFDDDDSNLEAHATYANKNVTSKNSLMVAEEAKQEESAKSGSDSSSDSDSSSSSRRSSSSSNSSNGSSSSSSSSSSNQASRRKTGADKRQEKKKSDDSSSSSSGSDASEESDNNDSSDSNSKVQVAQANSDDSDSSIEAGKEDDDDESEDDDSKCQICMRAVPPHSKDELIDWVDCDEDCGRWFHVICISRSHSKAALTKQFVCPSCRCKR